MKTNNNHHDKAANLLASRQLRKTQPRLLILSVLLQADCPLTQEQIAAKLGKTAPNKTTIYRTLMTLADRDLVHQAYIQNRIQYFELAHHCRADQCHPHFTCNDCGRTLCFHDTLIPKAQNIPAGFVIQHWQLRLEGICADCGKKEVS